MKITDKLKIKKIFKTKNYHYICQELKKLNIEISSLNKKEITYLINMAIYYYDYEMLKTLFPHLTKEERKVIIKKVWNSIYISYNSLFEEYIDEFLEVGMEIKNTAILYHISKLVTQNPQKYNEYKEQLQKFWLEVPVDNQVVAITLLKDFHSDALELKILDRGKYFIFEYLERCEIRLFLNFFLLYLEKKPNTLEVIELLKLFIDDKPKLDEIITGIRISHLELEQKALLYYQLLELKPNYELRAYLIETIINFNISYITKKTMKLIKEEEQNKICDYYLEKDNHDIIFTLSFATNCNKTYILIDKILKENKLEQTTTLIANLNGKFLNYALNKIIKEEGTITYLKIINQLYLFGLPNFLITIEYIFNYHFINKFSKEEITNLKLFYNKNKDNCKVLTRNKN